jgi:hypothetical protein
MNEPHDPNRTVDHSSAPADSLDAGLAAGLAAPHSGLGARQPGLLKVLALLIMLGNSSAINEKELADAGLRWSGGRRRRPGQRCCPQQPGHCAARLGAAPRPLSSPLANRC